MANRRPVPGSNVGDVSRYETALSRNLKNYQQMMAEMQSAKAEAGAPVSEEYQKVADIYKAGGAYGAGAYSRIRREQQAGVAASSANLARTGMSSGSMAQSVRSRYGREATAATQEVEDVRYERLGTALNALGAAREARGVRLQQVYQNAAGMISGWQEPTVGQFSSGLEEIAAQGKIQKTLTSLQGQYGLAQVRQQGTNAMELARYSSRRESSSGSPPSGSPSNYTPIL